MLWYLLGLTGVIFVHRVIYRLLNPDGIDRDAFAHLIYIREIRQANHRLPRKPSAVSTSGEYRYPPLMHWLLSFLPRRLLITVERYFSGLSDVALVGLFVPLLFLDLLGTFELLLAFVIFVGIPQFMRPDLSHGIGMSARKPGLLFTTVAHLSFIMWNWTGILWILFVSVLAGTSVYLTSKFGLQAYFFTGIALGAFLNPIYFVIMSGSLLIAVLVTRGYYLAVLEGQLRHLYTYATVTQFQKGLVSFPSVRNSLRIPLGERLRPRYLLRTLYNSRVLRPLLDNPFVVPALVASVYIMNTSGSGVASGLVLWTVAGFMSFVFTSLPYARFLGQPERYLEYTYLPAIVLVVRGWSVLGSDYKLLVVSSILAGISTTVVYLWFYNEIVRDHLYESTADELVEFLQSEPAESVVCQPTSISRRIAWETGHQVVDFILSGGSTSEATAEQERLYPDSYGVVTPDVDWLNCNYGLDLVIFDLSSEVDGLSPPASSPIFQNQFFEVYRWNQLTNTDESNI